MLIPIIKDFNDGFMYLMTTSSEKAQQMFLSKSLPAIVDPNSSNEDLHKLWVMSWTLIKLCFAIIVNIVKYFITFQWLRDFSYLPISIPFSSPLSSSVSKFLQSSSQPTDNKLVQTMVDSPNILQKYLFANETLTNNVQKALHYNDFLLGSSSTGNPLHSWSLSFLSNDWFDPLTVPVNFLSSKNLSQLSLPGFSETQPSSLLNFSDHSITHSIIMMILICVCTGFSSFVNSFLMVFPFSLSTILSLRYLIMQKFLAGCLSVLGIVCGELCFMLLLIVPPPFIQFSLVYLESCVPYIFGLGLMIIIIYDILCNPFNYSVSLLRTPMINKPPTNYPSRLPSFTPVSKSSRMRGFFVIMSFIKHVYDKIRWSQFMQNITNISPIYSKIFIMSFLLAFTEQSCIFSFFGSLNLTSTANFMDTYIFAASQSPLVLLFACIGLLLGSFLAMIIYNYILAKIIFLFTHIGIYYVNIVKRPGLQPSIFNMPIFSQNKPGNIPLNPTPTKITLSTILSSFVNIMFYVLNTIKQCIIITYHFFTSFLINFLPGARRIFFFMDGKKNFNTLNANNKLNPLDANKNKSWQQPSFLASLEAAIDDSFHNYNFNASGSVISNNASSPSQTNVPETSKDSSTVKQPLVNVANPFLYKKIDNVLLTCLISLSFTSIPYYSFDYVVNNVFGFIPQDQILNQHSLRVNFPDYNNLLGVNVSDENVILNTDVSLYDRAHFMYGEWPNSFESLNYQGEVMWTNLRDHRRQKRTRRSTRVKFKNFKSQISTSWKEFKENAGFYKPDNDSKKSLLSSSEEDQTSRLLSDNNQSTQNLRIDAKPLPTKSDHLSGLSKDQNQLTNHSPAKRSTVLQTFNNASDRRKYRYGQTADSNNIENLATNLALFTDNAISNEENQYQDNNNQNNINQNNINQDNNDQENNNENLPFLNYEAIETISPPSFKDFSGGEKYIKSYSQRWKKIIIKKYYQNPLYKALLSRNLEPFLTREPKSQQLTNNQEKELYFLRMKMAHYYDSLRFYYNMSTTHNNIFNLPQLSSFSENDKENSRLPLSKIDALENNDNSPNAELNNVEPRKSSENDNDRNYDLFNDNDTNYLLPPFEAKSLSSMNYRQQFKGTLKQVKKLVAVSLHNNKPSSNLQKNLQLPTSPTNNIENASKVDNDPYQTFYNYDKFLFNEHDNVHDSFFHEEARASKEDLILEQNNKSLGFNVLNKSQTNRTNKANVSNEEDAFLDNNTLTDNFSKDDASLKKTPIVATDQLNMEDDNVLNFNNNIIYNFFGSNDPFYVGWDQNLRKFVLTSRILPRKNALNRQISPKTNRQKTGKNIKNQNQPQSTQLYRPYTCWPFLSHQLNNVSNRPYFTFYEEFLNLSEKKIRFFDNLSDGIDPTALSFYFSYSLPDKKKEIMPRLPINIYKSIMAPINVENLFTPVSNARSTFIWPGNTMPQVWEYFFPNKNVNKQ